jgi:hypothetical protein
MDTNGDGIALKARSPGDAVSLNDTTRLPQHVTAPCRRLPQQLTTRRLPLRQPLGLHDDVAMDCTLSSLLDLRQLRCESSPVKTVVKSGYCRCLQ